MDNILTKRILTKLSGYLSSPTDMTRPERRCLKDMVTGILKSRSVFVNQIAASLREPLKLVLERIKDSTQRMATVAAIAFASNTAWMEFKNIALENMLIRT